MYLSLGKCDMSVERLSHPNKLLKYPLNSSHNLLSIEAVTLSQKPMLNQEQPSNLRQKFMMHVKSPTFLLPETDIS